MEAALPVFGFGVLQIGIKDFEAPRERDTQSTRYGGKPPLRGVAVGEIERRPRGEIIQDRLQLDRLVDLSEGMDAFLQPFGNGQIEWLNDVPAICSRGGLSPQKEIVDLVVDELAVALEILLVDVEPCSSPEETLESRHAHNMGRWRHSIDLSLSDQAYVIPAASSNRRCRGVTALRRPS